MLEVMRIGEEPSDDPAAYSYSHRLRTRFAETDAMGVVHHSQYAIYLEAARVEYLRAIGRPYDRQREEGIDFAVVELFVQYRAPLRFDEEVDVAVRLSGAARGAFTMEYLLSVGGQVRAVAATVHGATTPSGRPTRLPAWLREMAASAGASDPKAAVP